MRFTDLDADVHSRIVALAMYEAGRGASTVPWMGGRARILDRAWMLALPALALAVMAFGSFWA